MFADTAPPGMYLYETITSSKKIKWDKLVTCNYQLVHVFFLSPVKHPPAQQTTPPGPIKLSKERINPSCEQLTTWPGSAKADTILVSSYKDAMNTKTDKRLQNLVTLKSDTN